MTAYSPELKAQVIAEWMAGASEKGLAEAHGIPRTTLQKWVKGHERAPKQTPDDFDLDAMARELVHESFAALRAVLRKTQDASWLQQQNASDLAILFGVESDKLIRLLAAGARPANSDTPQLPINT